MTASPNDPEAVDSSIDIPQREHDANVAAQARRAVLHHMAQSELEAGVYDLVPDDFSAQ